MKIHATLALLGVPSDDGRLLAADGVFTMRDTVPITYEHEGIWTVGQFNKFHHIRGVIDPSGAINELIASGYLYEYEDVLGLEYEHFTVMIADVLAGKLFAEVELVSSTGAELGEHYVITSGTIARVRLGKYPTFPGCIVIPEPVGITLDDSTYGAFMTEYQQRLPRV